MKILFDHNVDRRLRRHLRGHTFQTAREMNWEALENGILLKTAADFGFDALRCIDKKMEYEQNLKKLPLAIVVLDAPTNSLPDLIPFAPHLLKLLESPLEKLLYVISIDGRVDHVREPRTKRKQ